MVYNDWAMNFKTLFWRGGLHAELIKYIVK